MGVCIMNAVKMRFLEDIDMDTVKIKKGEIVNMSTKGNHHLQFIKSGVAEIIQDEPKKDSIKTKGKKKDKKRMVEKNIKKKEKTIPHTLIKKPEEIINNDTEILPENTNILEPIRNDNTPKWLIISEKTNPPNKEEIKLIMQGEQTPWLHEKTFETIEENMWECKKCMGRFKSENQPETCLHCDRGTTFRKITKNISTNRWKLPRWKNIPIEEIEMIMVYHDLVDIIKQCIIFPEDIQYELFALWIVASYKKECFDTIPFFIFRGLIESGKTRALDLLRELGYRMVHTTGVTFTAMCRYTHFHGAGVLIDEIDNKIDKRTETGRNYIDFLKPSYKRGSIYACADLNDQEETKEYNNYGFKAFAGEKGGYDQAIFSRSIDVHMEKENPDIPELKYVQEDLDQLQTILLNYRYKFSDPIPLPLDYPLKGRDREIFSCLIQTAQHIGLGDEHLLEYIKQRKQEQIDEIQDSIEYEIIKAVYQLQHGETTIDGDTTLMNDAPEVLLYNDISSACGWNLDTEEGKKNRQRIGYIFKKKLLLKTKRRGQGTVLLLTDSKNEKRLENLYRRYHIK